MFVGLFLLARTARESERFGVDAPLANAVDLLGEAARGDLDEGGRARALALLRRSEPGDPLVAPLRALFEELPARPVAPPGRWARLVARVRAALERVAAWPGFPAALARLFQIWVVTSVVGALWRCVRPPHGFGREIRSEDLGCRELPHRAQDQRCSAARSAVRVWKAGRAPATS